MSPTKRPFQPTFLAFVANRSMNRMSCGLPQLRLRDSRMTCQAGPVIGSDSAPARQPLKSPPIERGGPGNGVDLRANSSLAGIDGAPGFFSGGSGLGLSEPGSIGSIKCFSCDQTEPDRVFGGDEDDGDRRGCRLCCERCTGTSGRSDRGDLAA